MENIMENYTMMAKIGEGGCGQIFMIKEIGTNNLFAVKKIIRTKDNLDGINRDIEIPKKISHDAVIRVLQHQITEEFAYIIYPYYKICFEAFTKRTVRPVASMAPTVPMLVEMMVQLCDALQCMHDMKIVHRDMKPANILLSEEQCKIIDFDMACIIDSLTFNIQPKYVGTPLYSAPELLLSLPNICYYMCDIYSLGVTMYEIFNKRLPYNGINFDVFVSKIKYNPPRKSTSGFTQLDSIIMDTISRDPNLRPSLSTIKERLRGLCLDIL